MRKRLMELIAESAIKGDYTYIPDVADHLIANGVTINEWISVDERLPEYQKFVIVCDEYGNVGEAYFYKADRKFEWVDDEERAFATHWMPLPEAPKAKGGAE